MANYSLEKQPELMRYCMEIYNCGYKNGKAVENVRKALCKFTRLCKENKTNIPNALLGPGQSNHLTFRVHCLTNYTPFVFVMSIFAEFS